LIHSATIRISTEKAMENASPKVDQEGRDRQEQDGQDDDNAEGKAHVLSLKACLLNRQRLRVGHILRSSGTTAPDVMPAQMVIVTLQAEACAKVACCGRYREAGGHWRRSTMRGVDGFGHADDPCRRAGHDSNPAAGPV
jgi:hypothetical protein